MGMKTLSDLLEHMMQDIYYAEKQILKTLPKMVEQADSADLRSAFEQHKSETEQQIARLERAFSAAGIPAKGVECEAIEGIIEESEELMEEAADGDVRDAAMIAAAQAVEHYEITRYGTIIAWAKELGKNEVAEILQETLDEEYATDKKLTELAESRLNRQAEQPGTQA